MPKKPGTNPKGEFAFFDVVYEDDSLRSNRRVPTELLGGLEGDEPARAFIHAQDQEIAEKGGRPALEIKSISRVGAKKKKVQASRRDLPFTTGHCACSRQTAGRRTGHR